MEEPNRKYSMYFSQRPLKPALTCISVKEDPVLTNVNQKKMYWLYLCLNDIPLIQIVKLYKFHSFH